MWTTNCPLGGWWDPLSSYPPQARMPSPLRWHAVHGEALSRRQQFMQEPKALGSGFLAHRIDARDVAARPIEAGDEAERDRVAAGAEDDRDGGGRGFGGKRRFRNAGLTITAMRRRTRSAAKPGRRSGSLAPTDIRCLR